MRDPDILIHVAVEEQHRHFDLRSVAQRRSFNNVRTGPDEVFDELVVGKMLGFGLQQPKIRDRRDRHRGFV